jgi:hypothetical protein
VREKPTHKLEGISIDGYSETMYFAVESGLLLKSGAGLGITVIVIFFYMIYLILMAFSSKLGMHDEY